MAAREGDRTRRRPALVTEELLAQRDLLRGDRIVVRDLRGVLLESERQLELEVRRQRPAGDQAERRWRGRARPALSCLLPLSGELNRDLPPGQGPADAARVPR